MESKIKVYHNELTHESKYMKKVKDQRRGCFRKHKYGNQIEGDIISRKIKAIRYTLHLPATKMK